jgi:hypothetical protein
VKQPQIIRLKPLTVRPKTAERLFEAPHLFNEMVRAGWVRPCYKSNRCTLYLMSDLEACALRLGSGQRPHA